MQNNSNKTDKHNPEPLPVADKLFINSKIYTVDTDNSWATALAVKNGIIIGIGSNESLLGMIGSNTVITDLNGQMVMPGIHDSHLHPLDALANSSSAAFFQPTLMKCQTSSKIVLKIFRLVPG